LIAFVASFEIAGKATATRRIDEYEQGRRHGTRSNLCEAWILWLTIFDRVAILRGSGVLKSGRF
jgi:hypothetical protein